MHKKNNNYIFIFKVAFLSLQLSPASTVLHNNNNRTNNRRATPAVLRELCMVPSPSPHVALSSFRTNETVIQRSTILTDPLAT